MDEELWINITKMKSLWYCKVILNWMTRQGHHYEVNDFEWKITNKEPDTSEDGIRIDILKSDNIFWFVIKTWDKIIDNIDSIMDERSNVLWYQNFILTPKHNNISQEFKLDLSKIEKDKEYIQYFDTDKQKYWILERSQFFNFL